MLKFKFDKKNFTRRIRPRRIDGEGGAGFALLVATLVSGLFLAISAVIFQIAYLQLLLSSTGRDSQFAFYAADTGAECALYWDRKYSQPSDDGSGSAFNVYNESTADYEGSNRQRIIGSSGSYSDLSPINCSGASINPARLGGSDAGPVYFRQGTFSGAGTLGQTFIKFQVTDGASNVRGCVEVVIEKQAENPPATSGPAVKTIIISRGYNICDITNNRRVERAIQVTIE